MPEVTEKTEEKKRARRPLREQFELALRRGGMAPDELRVAMEAYDEGSRPITSCVGTVIDDGSLLLDGDAVCNLWPDLVAGDDVAGEVVRHRTGRVSLILTPAAPVDA